MENPWKKIIFLLVLGVGLAFVFTIVYTKYSLIFSKRVDGRVVAISRIPNQDTGYVVAIRTKSKEIFTTDSQDPRWALISVNQCVRAKYFPLPPWNLNNSGTYRDATLIEIRDCGAEDGGIETQPEAPPKEDKGLIPGTNIPEGTKGV